jgi:hypothetical protein
MMMLSRLEARTEIACITNSMAKLRSKTLFVPSNDTFAAVGQNQSDVRVSGGTRRRKDCAVAARQARRDGGQRDLAGHDCRASRELAPRISEHAVDPDFREEGWQVLPVDAADFEEAALACDLFLAGDARIGNQGLGEAASGFRGIACGHILKAAPPGR